MHLNMKQNISYVCSPKGINLEGDFLFAWNQTEFRFDVLSVPQIYCSQSLRQIYWATKPSYRKPSNTKVQQKIMDQKFSARNVCKNCCTAKWCFFETIFFLGIFSNCVQFLLSPSFWETLGKQRNSYHTKVFIFVQFSLYWELIFFTNDLLPLNFSMSGWKLENIHDISHLAPCSFPSCHLPQL